MHGFIFRENVKNVKTLAEKWFIGYTIQGAEPFSLSDSDSRGLSGSQYAENLFEIFGFSKNQDKMNFTEPTDLLEYVKGEFTDNDAITYDVLTKSYYKHFQLVVQFQPAQQQRSAVRR